MRENYKVDEILTSQSKENRKENSKDAKNTVLTLQSNQKEN